MSVLGQRRVWNHTDPVRILLLPKGLSQWDPAASQFHLSMTDHGTAENEVMRLHEMPSMVLGRSKCLTEGTGVLPYIFLNHVSNTI